MFAFHRIRPRLVGTAALVVLLLGACQQVPMLPGLSPYRIDIQQGNVVTQDMVAKLKPGMSRQQVRFVLGTPPIVDPFHQDRWDYVYYLNRGGKVVEYRRLVLLFDGDTLKRIHGDVVPAESAPTAGKSPPTATGAAPAAPSPTVPASIPAPAATTATPPANSSATPPAAAAADSVPDTAGSTSMKSQSAPGPKEVTSVPSDSAREPPGVGTNPVPTPGDRGTAAQALEPAKAP